MHDDEINAKTETCPVTYEEITDAIRDRKTWEDRQATWYQMRHDGLRRRNKPWPNAADLHYPLADTLIEKQKPGYVGQVFATDTIASFTALQQLAQGYQTAAAQWFDYQLKQESNFEDELEIGCDRMLQNGKVPVKVLWDADKKQLRFEAINPVFLIVPATTGKLKDADWIVHVQHYSKHAYKRVKEFDHTAETMAAITSGENAPDRTQLEDRKFEREGLTKTAGKDQIVVWELFYRDTSGAWRVRTFSPSSPKRDLRPDFGLPYNKGVFGETNPPPPFFELNNELKDRGYYDPRGIVERVRTFEAKLCKDWNSLADYQTLTTAPIFAAPNGIAGTQNIRMIPGQILPFPLTAVQMPPAPMDIAQGMMGTRQTAQELVGVLDWNTPSNTSPKERKSATEVSLIGSQQDQGTNLRARRFRRELSHGLNLAWGILLQYKADALDFFYLDELQQLPREALGARYRIELTGSGDNNNRTFVMQKAVARLQMFKDDPFINQGELRKTVLEADDPRLVKRLFMNAGTQAAAQMEDQAQEITIMEIGFPAEVRPTDDDMAHLNCLFQYAQARMTLGGMKPEMVVLLDQHAQMHAQAAQKKTPDLWKQLAAQVTPNLRQLAMLAQGAKQQIAAAQQAQAMAPAAAVPRMAA